MLIKLSPQRSDDPLVVSKSGDALTINGDEFDFAGIPEGGSIPGGVVPNKYFLGPVERIGGEIQLTLLLPHGSNPEQWQAFPEPLVGVPDGPVDLPVNTIVAVKTVTTVTTTIKRWRQAPVVEVDTFEETH